MRLVVEVVLALLDKMPPHLYLVVAVLELAQP
jgi:hypothetical protein